MTEKNENNEQQDVGLYEKMAARTAELLEEGRKTFDEALKKAKEELTSAGDYTREQADKIGNYVRWINLEKLLNQEKEKEEKELNIKLTLTNGGFICDIVENTNGKPNLLCKNNFNRLFEVSLNKCIVFQKLNNHENIIMSILQYISND